MHPVICCSLFYSFVRVSLTSEHSIKIDVLLYSLFSDRIVIVGNHHDGWVYGAMDPSAGTAVMLEMSRVLVEYKKTGIIFTV